MTTAWLEFKTIAAIAGSFNGRQLRERTRPQFVLTYPGGFYA